MDITAVTGSIEHAVDVVEKEITPLLVLENELGERVPPIENVTVFEFGY